MNQYRNKAEPAEANYLVVTYVLSLLEGFEIGEGVYFFPYDTSSKADVREIVEKYIRPAYDRVHPDNRAAIRRSFEFYLTARNAPFNEIWNERQELSLDTDDPYRFFELVGEVLFGDDFLDCIDVRNYKERIDPEAVNWAWSTTRKT